MIRVRLRVLLVEEINRCCWIILTGKIVKMTRNTCSPRVEQLENTKNKRVENKTRKAQGRSGLKTANHFFKTFRLWVLNQSLIIILKKKRPQHEESHLLNRRWHRITKLWTYQLIIPQPKIALNLKDSRKRNSGWWHLSFRIRMYTI